MWDRGSAFRSYMTCGWPWIFFSLGAELCFLDPEWLTSRCAPWSRLRRHLHRSECPQQLVSMPAYCDLIESSRVTNADTWTKHSVYWLTSQCDPVRSFTLTSSSGAGSCSCPKTWNPASLLVTAAEACSQHRFHVLMLCSILCMAQALRLLTLLAATRSAVVAAGATPPILKGRKRIKEARDSAACSLNYFLLWLKHAKLESLCTILYFIDHWDDKWEEHFEVEWSSYSYCFHAHTHRHADRQHTSIPHSPLHHQTTGERK